MQTLLMAGIQKVPKAPHCAGGKRLIGMSYCHRETHAIQLHGALSLGFKSPFIAAVTLHRVRRLSGSPIGLEPVLDVLPITASYRLKVTPLLGMR